MDRYGAYNEEEWHYGRRKYDEYKKEARHYQGRTRQEFQCQICGEHGHIAPSCRMRHIRCQICGERGHIAPSCRLYRKRYQEVCNACGNYGHSSYTCSWSNGYYEASTYEQYNEQGVYQQERWSNHHSNPYNLGWNDYTYDSPQNRPTLEDILQKSAEETKHQEA